MRRCFYTLFAIFALLPALAQAGPPLPGTGCDSEFMGVLEVHAWMQGKQDLEAAQELLTRPNSIMEISCFELAAQYIGNFTDTRYAGMQQLPTIQRAISNTLVEHFGNFTRTNTTSPVCTWMKDVWQAAKCLNFDKDKFWTWQQMQSTDPRVNFQACNTQRNLWQAAMPAAFPVPALPAALGGMDRVTPYFNILAPNSCFATVAVETGLMVKNPTTQTPFRERICLAPGCWYNNVSNSCENP